MDHATPAQAKPATPRQQNVCVQLGRAYKTLSIASLSNAINDVPVSDKTNISQIFYIVHYISRC